MTVVVKTSAPARRGRNKPTARRGKSPERREVDWPQMLNGALTVPGQLTDTYCRFYRYSFLNQLMLLAQGVTEPCASFATWIKLGRVPVRGGGRAVLHPYPVTEVDEKTGEKKVVRTRFFPKATAFPYSQTTGPEVEWPELPAWDWQQAYDALGVQLVPFDGILDGNIQGLSYGNTLMVSPIAKYPAKTALHELAHLVLGHCADGPAAERPCRDVCEFQAEATAHPLAHELDLCEWDPSESRAYIQGWLGGEDVKERDIRAVFAAVDKILRAGRTTSAAEE